MSYPRPLAEMYVGQPKAEYEAELEAACAVAQWRIENLYYIVDKDGQRTLFKPWAEQRRLLDTIWYRNHILKARQRGFSTMIQVLGLDSCLFNPNVTAAVIAQDEPAAIGIFRKIKFAYENLPPEVRGMVGLKTDKADELIFTNNSSFRVATSARSGTLQFLHVSEFGKICAKYPDKAREVVTGSLPAVAPYGMCFIESTAEGREGAFYEMTQNARALADSGRKLTHLDYKFHFASWWNADEYRVNPKAVAISGPDHDYFTKIEHQIGRHIEEDRRAWYVLTRETMFQSDPQLMKQEYPSTPDEAFEQSAEGVYYAQQLSLARRQGRICDLPYDPRLPVNTFWDLGKDDDTAIWFHQKVGAYDHFIDYFEASDQAFSFYVQALQAKGYVWGRHYLPHDGEHRAWGADQLKTAEDMLNDLGLRNTEIVPRTPNLTIAIRQVRDAMARYKWDQTKCAPGIYHLDHYRKTWSDRLGAWTEAPLKNGHQHAADAIRQHAQKFASEPAVTTSTRPKRRASAMAV